MKGRPALIAAVMVLSLVLLGCSTTHRAERKGKEAGEELCKAKNADNADEAQRHINRANDKVNDLARFTGRDVHEDVRDFQRNLDQLSRGGASEQDINAMIRSVQEARSSAYGNAVAAYDGILEALADCE